MATIQGDTNSELAARFAKAPQERVDKRYFLMQVPEDPGFYVPTPPKGGKEYAHVGTLDGSISERNEFTAAKSKRYGSYIVRAPPSSRRLSAQTNVNPAGGVRHAGERRSLRPQRENRHFAVLDPLVEESLHRSISQQNRLSCIVTPTKAKIRPNPTSPPSESRQRRTLSRFTKELERYCVAASTNGRAPLPPSTPTVSESPTTLNTVAEFLPYHNQFKAAGLAVTSREQMPRIPESAHPQLPPRHAGRVRGTKVAVVQVDGSTVTPSEQAVVPRNPAAPTDLDKTVASSSNPQPTSQASQPQLRPVTKSLLPWFKKNPSLSCTAHGDRRFSRDHMHPSQPTPAEPLLTPFGFMDSYFDSPQPSKLRDERPIEQNTSLSSTVSSTRSSHTDKPLPKQPPIKRRPIPPRSERRHMENTAEWPTAGILIHETSPSSPRRNGSTGRFHEKVAPANDSNSVHSWTTVEDDVPVEPQKGPPLPPKAINDATSMLAEVENKPETPPKDEPTKGPESQQAHRHPGLSLYRKWMKASGIRRRVSAKSLPLPITIREESEVPADDSEQPQQVASGHNDAAPRIPVHLPLPVDDASSFEKALDAVISKLDAMEERRRYERKMDFEAARQALDNSRSPDKASSKVARRKPSSTSDSEQIDLASALEVTPSPEAAIEHSDRDISDRDILLGLKMAICAACDEDLDAWICKKTGLRLRRFLADLKAFDSVSQDRRPSQLLPMSRRIRRNDKENRRLQAERERRKRNSKPWSPCFGADGQASYVEPHNGAYQDLVAE